MRSGYETKLHTYTATHIHSYTHTQLHTYTATHIHSHTHTQPHTYTATHIHSHTHTQLYTCTATHMHSYTHTQLYTHPRRILDRQQCWDVSFGTTLAPVGQALTLITNTPCTQNTSSDYFFTRLFSVLSSHLQH